MSLTCHNCHQIIKHCQALPSTSIHEELDGTIDIVVALVGGRSVGRTGDQPDQDPRDRIHGDLRCEKRVLGRLKNMSGFPPTGINQSIPVLYQLMLTSHGPYRHGIISMFDAVIIEQEAVIITSNSYLSWLNACPMKNHQPVCILIYFIMIIPYNPMRIPRVSPLHPLPSSSWQ